MREAALQGLYNDEIQARERTAGISRAFYEELEYDGGPENYRKQTSGCETDMYVPGERVEFCRAAMSAAFSSSARSSTRRMRPSMVALRSSCARASMLRVRWSALSCAAVPDKSRVSNFSAATRRSVVSSISARFRSSWARYSTVDPGLASPRSEIAADQATLDRTAQ